MTRNTINQCSTAAERSGGEDGDHLMRACLLAPRSSTWSCGDFGLVTCFVDLWGQKSPICEIERLDIGEEEVLLYSLLWPEWSVKLRERPGMWHQGSPQLLQCLLLLNLQTQRLRVGRSAWGAGKKNACNWSGAFKEQGRYLYLLREFVLLSQPFVSLFFLFYLHRTQNKWTLASASTNGKHRGSLLTMLSNSDLCTALSSTCNTNCWTSVRGFRSFSGSGIGSLWQYYKRLFYISRSRKGTNS